MMLAIYIVLVAFGALSHATEEPSCLQKRPTHCFSPELDKVQFPDSEEALNRICPILLPTFKCMVDFKNKCDIKSPLAYVQELDMIYYVLNQACDKKTDLHQGLSTNLPCYHEVVMSYHNSCKPMSKAAIDKIASELSLERDEDGEFANEEDKTKYSCLAEASDLACLVASISVRCGDDAKDVIAGLVSRVLDIACPANIRDPVKDAVEIEYLEMIVKIAAEEINSII